MLQMSREVTEYGLESYTRDSFNGIAERMNLSSEELDIIFTAVDTDGDGIINKSDLMCESPHFNSTPIRRKTDLSGKSKHPFKNLASDFSVLSTDWLVSLSDRYFPDVF